MDGKLIEALNIVSVAVAWAGALECAVGRVLAMDKRHHRVTVMLAYFGGAVLCMFAALADGPALVPLRVAATCVACHLLATWNEWRDGPPWWALREPERELVPEHIEHRNDDGRG